MVKKQNSLKLKKYLLTMTSEFYDEVWQVFRKGNKDNLDDEILKLVAKEVQRRQKKN